MSKLINNFIISLAVVTSSYAFDSINLEVGTGIWKPNLSGSIQYGKNNPTILYFDDLNIKDKINFSNNYYYIDFNHFVPLIPNLKLESLNYSLKGDTSNRIFIYNFDDITSTASIQSNFQISQTDIITYWEVPFIQTATTGILSVDFGLDIMRFKSSIIINNREVSFDKIVPPVYLNAKINFPFSPLKLHATTKNLSYNNISISDNEARLSYELTNLVSLMTLNVELGYKVKEIKIPKTLVDNLDLKVNTSGIFLGINAQF